ncbi:MAG: alpha/beta hydrolase [Sandaracinaceae bacterium]|nr:alpha/beta hydrolase [Myxococcales bacterium]MCB9657870.1 alpha/beta hydrolase [Sandaracinaceae bacterium]
MTALTLPDTTFHYDTWGNGERAALLCLHGGGCAREHFEALGGAFGAERRVVAMDQRAHGESADAAGPYDVPTLADDAARVVEALSLGPVVVVGHSLGGAVAESMLEQARVDVRAIVSVDAPLALPAMMAGALMSLREALLSPERVDEYRAFMAPMVGFPNDPERAERLLDQLSHFRPAAMAEILASVASYAGGPVLAAHPNVPVLHIDAGTGVCELDRLRELRPDAWIGAVVGTRHYPHIESPEQVAAMMRHFFGRYDL